MKKVLLIVVLLMAICLSGFAQTGIYSGGISNKIIRKTGFVIRPEMGFGYDGWYNTSYFALQANLGYQITPCIYVGGGFGGDIGARKGYNYDTGNYGHAFGIPLYADFRWYWLKGESSPFLEVNTGACYVSEYRGETYFLFTPYIGYDIKNFDIKIGSPDLLGIIFSIGYNILIQ